MPILSWITGWANVSGWVSTLPSCLTQCMLTLQVALTATGGLLGSELVIGVISLMHPVCSLPQKMTGPGLFSRHMNPNGGINS